MPLVAGAYCLVALFYAAMATLGGQGRPAPVALAFFCGAFFIAPTSGYALTFVACAASSPPLPRRCRARRHTRRRGRAAATHGADARAVASRRPMVAHALGPCRRRRGLLV